MARRLGGNAGAEEAAAKSWGGNPGGGREEAASAAGLGHDSVASSSPGVVRRLHLCGTLNAGTFPLHLSSVNSEAKRRKLQLREQTLATGGERVLAGRVVGLWDVSRLSGERPLVQAPGRQREGPRGETRPSGGSSSDGVGGGGQGDHLSPWRQRSRTRPASPWTRPSCPSTPSVGGPPLSDKGWQGRLFLSPSQSQLLVALLPLGCPKSH